MLLMSALSAILFLGGWQAPFCFLSFSGLLDSFWFGIKNLLFRTACSF